MYDADGNGVIDLDEMTKIVEAIYEMMGSESTVRPVETPEQRARTIFARIDTDNDGCLTQEEFIKGCMMDGGLAKMLAPKFQTSEFIYSVRQIQESK